MFFKISIPLFFCSFTLLLFCTSPLYYISALSLFCVTSTRFWHTPHSTHTPSLLINLSLLGFMVSCDFFFLADRFCVQVLHLSALPLLCHGNAPVQYQYQQPWCVAFSFPFFNTLHSVCRSHISVLTLSMGWWCTRSPTCMLLPLPTQCDGCHNQHPRACTAAGGRAWCHNTHAPLPSPTQYMVPWWEVVVHGAPTARLHQDRHPCPCTPALALTHAVWQWHIRQQCVASQWAAVACGVPTVRWCHNWHPHPCALALAHAYAAQWWCDGQQHVAPQRAAVVQAIMAWKVNSHCKQNKGWISNLRVVDQTYNYND